MDQQAGRLSAVISSDIKKEYIYNVQGQMVLEKARFPDGSEIDSHYQWHLNNVLQSKKITYQDFKAPPREDVIEYLYDPSGELQGLKVNGKLAITFQYDEHAQLSEVTSAEGDQVRYRYDPLTQR